MPVFAHFFLSCVLLLLTSFAYANDLTETSILKAQHMQLAQDKTWQRLMYADHNKNSEVSYAGYFYHADGRQNIQAELNESIQQLFIQADDNQSIRCKFPARSAFLIAKLEIPPESLPPVRCTEYEDWIKTIAPHQVVLIYATDFMGNPSSMFGHTLFRIDPQKQQGLSLVSYAINYAATVPNEQSWSYAWKGLTGQYPGEYALMPYYHKVKEYGDFESRDLWEYELNLSPEETQFLVAHLWEMKNVSFPYYFIHDNCAYRLLGLLDLVRPDLNLKQQFKSTTIPVEIIKVIADADLIGSSVYRPALETQLLSQEKQHGQLLATEAKKLVEQPIDRFDPLLDRYSLPDQPKILEMAYDHLYLSLLAHRVDSTEAQPKLRALLQRRSQRAVAKQRVEVETPLFSPKQGHHARQMSASIGQVQQQSVVELGARLAYHDLKDPIQGYRMGTSLKFFDVQLQWRDQTLKLKELGLLSVNAYQPKNVFRRPWSWGFDLAWQQEALDMGQFSTEKQHGVFNLNTQIGQSVATASMTQLCFAQAQAWLQAGQALDDGWRLGLGPTWGCQSIWSEHIQSWLQVSLPYWSDAKQWQLRTQATMQYRINAQQVLRFNIDAQQQQKKSWQSGALSYHWYY